MRPPPMWPPKKKLSPKNDKCKIVETNSLGQGHCSHDPRQVTRAVKSFHSYLRQELDLLCLSKVIFVSSSHSCSGALPTHRPKNQMSIDFAELMEKLQVPTFPKYMTIYVFCGLAEASIWGQAANWKINVRNIGKTLLQRFRANVHERECKIRTA